MRYTHIMTGRGATLRMALFTIAVLLTGGTALAQVKVHGNVYGGGNLADVGGSVTVNMSAGTVEKDVYGGGALANTNINNATSYNGTGTETISSTSVNTTTVRLTGGTIKGDAYGGGLGRIGVEAKAAVNYTEEEATTYNSEHNLNLGDDGYVTTETIKTPAVAAVTAVAALVYGDVSVTLGTTDDDATATAFNISHYDGTHSDVVKSGRVFGCNNLNGYPLGNVKVTVNKTEAGNVTRTASDKLKLTTTDAGYVAPTYEVAAVYGGGNLADYKATGKKASVRIETCDVSIRDVYGGGNAAEVPETDVLVRGAYEIQEVFGGGNGRDPYTTDGGTTWTDNPGANIGNQATPGNATTLLTGGYVHEAYGGSNKKGTIYGNISIDMGTGSSVDNTNGICTLDVEKLVGGGKDADVYGDLIMVMDCKPDVKTPVLYAGADNANVNGDVELTITSGKFGKVFGGNNQGGLIMGHIILNIEETGECETPIEIDELYLGGNEAMYSRYGYYKDGDTYKPRTAEMADGESANYHPAVTTAQFGTEVRKTAPYDAPQLNIVSCTYIGKVFGGGFGTGATLYGDPTVNINMIQGHFASGIPTKMTALGIDATEAPNPNKLGIIGDVYGGGNAAVVEGNTTVNIGTKETVQTHLSYDATSGYTRGESQNVLGAYITGNVFGGGNEADVTGDTHVNICGTQVADSEAENGYTDTAVDHSGTAGFAVSIGNSVYGGGSEADVLGNTFVTMADGYVFNGIFGGGFAGSVGTFTKAYNSDVTDWGHTTHTNPEECSGKPTACAAGTGTCYVVVSGGQIGPIEVATQGMKRMTGGHGDPVPQGWVWGGGCGKVENPADDQDTHFKTYVNNTDVTIKDSAFILESIIGGGEFGRVLGNTLVKIQGGQIGVGENYTETVNGVVRPKRYTAAQWAEAAAAVKAGNASRIDAIAGQMPACSHYDYGRNDGTAEAPVWVYDTYDPYADAYKADQGDYLYPGGSTDKVCDGKTWIGCVFAGGSGYIPYLAKNSDGKITGYDWVGSAGWVEGNTEVRITGGHVLTNVYGGNEYTDVKGKCTVKISGGTVGVPRTRSQIMNNPMIGLVYGAGKGDPRVHFNQTTNVGSVEVLISGDAMVYGSVYGGGEDGHVLGDVSLTVKETTTTEGEGAGAVTTTHSPFIGTWGTTYLDGNIFGGGRGFVGEALTAGVVSGNVTVDIQGGTMLGSVFGGGRLASVGTYLVLEDHANYGKLIPDGKEQVLGGADVVAAAKTHGWITVNVSGGTIGNNHEYVVPSQANSDIIPLTVFNNGHLVQTKGGNVFAGCMGRIKQMDGTTDLTRWPDMGRCRATTLNFSGGNIKSNIYGGSELGAVGVKKDGETTTATSTTTVLMTGGTVGTDVRGDDGKVAYSFGSIYGGGYGDEDHEEAGQVYGNARITITNGEVKQHVFGGGNMAKVTGNSDVIVGEKTNH